MLMHLNIIRGLWRNLLFTIWIRVSKGLPGSGAWGVAQKDIVQVAFVRWRGDSKIVEANAEHDFCFKRLIGMLRTTKRAQYPFVPPPQAPLPGRPFDTRILYGKKRRMVYNLLFHAPLCCYFDTKMILRLCQLPFISFHSIFPAH